MKSMKLGLVSAGLLTSPSFAHDAAGLHFHWLPAAIACGGVVLAIGLSRFAAKREVQAKACVTD